MPAFPASALVVLLIAAASFAFACAPATEDRGVPETSAPLHPAGSYFDRQERFALLRATRDPVLLGARRAARVCAPADMPEPVGLLDVPSFYGDPPGYAKADAPLRRFQDFITHMAESYVLSRESKHAHCVAAVLARWARANSLVDFRHDTGSRQSWYNAVWTTVSAAFAYSIVRDESTLPGDVRPAIDIWLHTAARKHLSIAGGQRDCCNNHAFWRGLEAAIVGAAIGDRDMIMMSTKTYRAALQSMNPDGSFPLEMERGERAIHYQNFAILPLVYIAEIAYRQKIDLYGSKMNGKSLNDAVAFLLGAIENPAAVAAYTDRVQDLSFLDRRSELNWMEPYNRRFQSVKIAEVLGPRRPIIHRYGGGNSTLYFYSPDRAK
jgi:poly(beta-D-mannuronate) lyase